MASAVRLLGRVLDAVLGTPLQPPERGCVPEGVVLRSARWIPWVAGVLGRMPGPAAAVTLRRSIVIHPGSAPSRRLLAHELVHVRQWREDPWFPVKYAAQSLRHGYWMNRYEVEARAEVERLFPPVPTRTPRHE